MIISLTFLYIINPNFTKLILKKMNLIKFWILIVIMSHYTLISYNVDGYNAEIHSYISSLLASKPDVVFLSETKKKREDLIAYFDTFTEYNYIINAHEPARYHGVIMLIRKDHVYEQLNVNLAISCRKDSKSQDAAVGRIITIKLNNVLNIIGSYTPNSGRGGEPDKFDYRVKVWDPAFAYILEILRNSGHTLWMGDINVALNDIDVSSPKTMKVWAGFRPEERANLNALLSSGKFIDIWRRQNPDKREYTWLGYPHRNNYGMRLDNVIVSESLVPYMLNSFILTPSPPHSDHAPVGAYIMK